jgi:hypothetical protein
LAATLISFSAVSTSPSFLGLGTLFGFSYLVFSYSPLSAVLVSASEETGFCSVVADSWVSVLFSPAGFDDESFTSDGLF